MGAEQKEKKKRNLIVHLSDRELADGNTFSISISRDAPRREYHPTEITCKHPNHVVLPRANTVVRCNVGRS